MPAVRMTKVIPIATSPEIDTCRSTLSRFSGVRNRGDSSGEDDDEQQEEQRRGVAREERHRIPSGRFRPGRVAHRAGRPPREAYCTSFSRSALSRLSLVIATGVSSTSGSGFVPSRR